MSITATSAAMAATTSETLLRDHNTVATSSSNASTLENGHVHSEAVKIVVLGAACSGKTSVIKQFTGNGQEFAEEYFPTDRKSNHFKTVLTFDTNTQKITHWALKIVDVPVTEVPVAALFSWSNFLQFDIGNAAAYVIMFDVNAQYHSFDFVRSIRDQLINHPATCNALIFIVGNKVDLPYQLTRTDLLHIASKQWKCPFLETIIEAVQAKQSAARRAHHSDGFRRTFPRPKCIIQ